MLVSSAAPCGARPSLLSRCLRYKQAATHDSIALSEDRDIHIYTSKMNKIERRAAQWQFKPFF